MMFCHLSLVLKKVSLFSFPYRYSKSFFFLLFFCLSFFAFGEEWVLAAKKFDYNDKKSHDSAEENFASVLPSVIMEKISVGLSRNVSLDEILDRELDSLLLDRQSLFLRLSSAVKTRDAIVIAERKEKKLKKKIALQNKTIAEIEKEIDENLKKTKELISEYERKNSEDEVSSSFSSTHFNPFKNLFVKKSPSVLEERNENISFYNSDDYSLFSVSDEEEADSRVFERAAVKAGINGMIDGKITVYGEYFSVYCVIYRFPGREIIGEVTEVGAMKDYILVAENVAEHFVATITNGSPVELSFEIQPEEIRDSVIITVDREVYRNIPDKVLVSPGFHLIKIESKGYISRTINYDFSGAKRFLVQGNMKEETDLMKDIFLQGGYTGSLYSGSSLVSSISPENPSASLHFDGTSVIGQFRLDDAEDTLFFYYISSNDQENKENIMIKGKPKDHASYIDRRRILAYRAYTALVISVPFTLYAVGKYYASSDARNTGSSVDTKTVDKWRNRGIIAGSITGLCFCIFGYELTRYLIAANSLLPAKVKEAKEGDIQFPAIEDVIIENENEMADEEEIID